MNREHFQFSLWIYFYWNFACRFYLIELLDVANVHAYFYEITNCSSAALKFFQWNVFFYKKVYWRKLSQANDNNSEREWAGFIKFSFDCISQVTTWHCKCSWVKYWKEIATSTVCGHKFISNYFCNIASDKAPRNQTRSVFHCVWAAKRGRLKAILDAKWRRGDKAEWHEAISYVCTRIRRNYLRPNARASLVH